MSNEFNDLFNKFFGPESRETEERMKRWRGRTEGERNYTNPDQLLIAIDDALRYRVESTVPANSTKPNQLVRLITLHNGSQVWLTLEERRED